MINTYEAYLKKELEGKGYKVVVLDFVNPVNYSDLRFA